MALKPCQDVNQLTAQVEDQDDRLRCFEGSCGFVVQVFTISGNESISGPQVSEYVPA